MTRRIGVLGGTFDPPHNGHVALARAGTARLGLDLVLLIPTNIPPHKRSNGADAGDRLAMTRLAAQEIPGARVSDIELRRGGVSYTVDTMRQLRLFYPLDELVFLCGSDMFLSLHTWRRAAEILSMCRIAAADRHEDGADAAELAAQAARLRGEFGARITMFKFPAVEVSSTQLRSTKDRALLPPAVYRYIEEHALYY